MLGLSVPGICGTAVFIKLVFQTSLLRITAVTLNHVDEVFRVTGQVRFYAARFTGGREGICGESVRNVGTSSTVFVTKEGTRRKLGIGRIRGEFNCD